jgi:hypothetical protein
VTRCCLPVLGFLLFLPAWASADPATDATQCKQAAGSLVIGTVTHGPTFRRGKPEHGVYLSHTHLTLTADDGTSYDVAIDNVFANGYRRNQAGVPAPLNTIHTGDRLELCGEPYASGDIGIHWVHTNCGATPTADKPDGWVRKVDPNGDAGSNMEANQAFCSIWPD